MKKILLILTIFSIVLSCRDEDQLVTPGIGYFPLTVINGIEEGDTIFTVELETSKVITKDGALKISVTNGEFLTTVPAMNNGIISLIIPSGERKASFTVKVGDDDLVNDYFATFEITSVDGGIQSILPSSQFTIVVADIDQKAFFFDDFENGSLCKWISEDVSGSNNWEIGSYNSTYALISSYQNTGLSDDWLIMPEINFDNFESEFLSFESQTNFNDGNVLSVVVLTDYSGSGDPTNATSIALEPVLDPKMGGGFGNFTESGVIDLSMMTGTGHVAFHYKATDASDGSTWQLDNVLLSVNDAGGLIEIEGGEDCGASSVFDDIADLLYSDAFEDCSNVGRFNIPANWSEESLPGFKTDRGWGCTRPTEGHTGSGVRGSAFSGDAGEDDAWLISSSAFDLTAVSEATLRFWVEERFEGPGELAVQWSTDYSGSGDPTSATWNVLSEAATQIAAIPLVTYTEITVDISTAAGSSVYIAFRYTEGTDASSRAYTIDDFSIAGK